MTERILAVDDGEAIRDIVSSMLVDAGYKCRQAGSGNEALAVLNCDERDREFSSCNRHIPPRLVSGQPVVVLALNDHDGRSVVIPHVLDRDRQLISGCRPYGMSSEAGSVRNEVDKNRLPLPPVPVFPAEPTAAAGSAEPANAGKSVIVQHDDVGMFRSSCSCAPALGSKLIWFRPMVNWERSTQ
jgi:hypothetical protein